MFMKRIADIKQAQEVERLSAENAELKATIDYLAMMTDVDIAKEEEQNVREG